MILSARDLYINMTNSNNIDISEGAQTPGATGDQELDSVDFTYKDGKVEVSGFLSLHADNTLSYSFSYDVDGQVFFDIELVQQAYRVTMDNDLRFQVTYTTIAGDLSEIQVFDKSQGNKCIYHLCCHQQQPVLQLIDFQD